MHLQARVQLEATATTLTIQPGGDVKPQKLGSAWIFWSSTWPFHPIRILLPANIDDGTIRRDLLYI